MNVTLHTFLMLYLTTYKCEEKEKKSLRFSAIITGALQGATRIYMQLYRISCWLQPCCCTYHVPTRHTAHVIVEHRTAAEDMLAAIAHATGTPVGIAADRLNTVSIAGLPTQLFTADMSSTRIRLADDTHSFDMHLCSMAKLWRPSCMSVRTCFFAC